MKFIAILFLLVLTSCGYNSLQGLDEDVKAAWSEVENQYQRRAELVPNLVQTVKGYARHEKETLSAVVEARAKATSITLNPGDLSDPAKFKNYQQSQDALSNTLSRLLVTMERYPDLKANTNFRDLQAQLEGTENRISVARRRYIESVATYNKGIRSFPTNLTAKYLLHLSVRETFTAPEGSKVAPKVEF